MSGVPMARAHESKGLRKDRGSALVEATIVLPLLVLLVLGIVELGFMFRSASVVNTSSRSGARLAAAQYGSATSGAQQATVIDNVRLTVEKDLGERATSDTPLDLWVYKADSNGNPPSGGFSTCGSPCYVYSWDGTSGHFVLNGGNWSNPVVCGTSHDGVGVFVRLSHGPLGFANFFGTIDLTEHTVMRLEPPNPNTCPQGS
jgi:hypothetical protein